MNIEALLGSGVETAFRILKDLVGLGTFYQSLPSGGISNYDPVTDTVGEPFAKFENVRMIKVALDPREITGSVLVLTDVKLIIPAKDLGLTEPDAADYVDLKGVRYNVIRPKEIPGNAIHILYCREA